MSKKSTCQYKNISNLLDPVLTGNRAFKFDHLLIFVDRPTVPGTAKWNVGISKQVIKPTNSSVFFLLFF